LPWSGAVYRGLCRGADPSAARAYGAGRPDDVGDVTGVDGFCVEVKCHRALDLAGWADEASREAVNAGAGIVGVVVAKRQRRPAENAYAVLRLTDFATLAS